MKIMKAIDKLTVSSVSKWWRPPLWASGWRV